MTKPTPSNNLAYTAPINPPSASPKLSTAQIWRGLELKIRAGQDFVGGALLSTDIISESQDDQGRPVTVREVVFRDGNRRVRETCVAFKPMKVEFHQPDGSKVQNVISQGAGEEGVDLYMTYTFEWLHPECEGAQKELEEKRRKETQVAKMAVEETIRVMREMVRDGRIK
ncbi:hypothetical protein A1O7_01284 [Cladophialophora yegresii CBS 114405]|uniref:DUF1857-domain-containing protein n=1 Tax=Cladophialophora yegresii CBS 114405 TaxID=1182544 RepID=W9WJ03_9EURO|nr:uncharacterized protein A1O7_01284 [Cladophialophora yegresii CBS 114405]EXJ64945.1 hypothetical protein A1O7_01284 [Cladophialophora yegresii CBS 114405]